MNMFCSLLLPLLLLTELSSANQLQSDKRVLNTVIQQTLPPVWVKPSWWPRYRKEIGKKVLKKCLFLNGQVPTPGSKCEPKDDDYMCLFGEQCCRLADGTVETHPQVGCSCKKDQPTWICHDVNIVCEPCAKVPTLQKDTTIPPYAAKSAPPMQVDPLPTTIPPDAAKQAPPMQVDPLPTTIPPDAAMAAPPMQVDPLPNSTLPDAAMAAPPMQVDPLPNSTLPDSAMAAPPMQVDPLPNSTLPDAAMAAPPMQVDPLPTTTPPDDATTAPPMQVDPLPITTTTIDVPTTAVPTSSDTVCPTDQPMGGACQGDLECMYGTESCCGATHPSMRCVCRGDQWGCMYLDMCMSQTCT